MSTNAEICVKCKNEYSRDLVFCPSCNSMNIKSANWIPDTLKLEYINKYDVPSTPVTKKFLKIEFRKILKKHKKIPQSLTLKKIRDVPLGILSYDDYNKRLELQYNLRILSMYTYEEIKQLLECRVLILNIMKGSSIHVQNTSQIHMEYLTEFTTLYDSYLMYNNHSLFFENNKIIRKIKHGELVNFAIINYSMIHMIKSNKDLDPMMISLMMTTIFQDALYFMFYNKTMLYEHAKKYDYETRKHKFV